MTTVPFVFLMAARAILSLLPDSMKPLLLTLLLVLPAFCFAETADEAAVRSAHASLVAAVKAGDGAVLGTIFADGVQYSHSNAMVETKAQAIAALVKSKTNFEVHDQVIHVYGNVATIRAKVTAHNATDDIPLTILQVWKKTGSQWQMVERQTTRIPPSTAK
jgi:ketosteroid isomerase-like protein